MEIIIAALILIIAILSYLLVSNRHKLLEKEKEVSQLNDLIYTISTEKTNDNNRLSIEIDSLRTQYKDIIDVDEAIQDRKNTIFSFIEKIDKVKKEYIEKRAFLKSLEDEINVYENKLNDISFGLYSPVYNYDTSGKYSLELFLLREKQSKMIKEESAYICDIEWTVSGSRTEGKRMTKQFAKLMLRGFNGETDSIIARVSWNNIGKMEARIFKVFEAINKLGETQQTRIKPDYLDLKLAELRLEYELQEKLHAEKEEQRLIREQMREEERALKEFETAQKKAHDDEERYQKALAKARQDVEKATGEKLDSLNGKILELEASLEAARLQKERAISMAQMTKSGHVYVISNIGSFGEDIFKIGMTRRLEPMDRVRELGDASVPFSFDVHGLIYCDNAPELENFVHKKLKDQRLNLLSNRREFFKIEIDKIEQLFIEAGHPLSLTKLAEAREYRESKSIRETKSLVPIEIASPFPETLEF